MTNFSWSSGEKKPLELPPLPLGSVAPNWSQFWVHQVIKGTRGELAKIEIEILKSCCLVEGQGAKAGRSKKYHDWGREGRTCVQLWARSSTEQHLPTGQSLGLETVETAPVPPPGNPDHLTRPVPPPNFLSGQFFYSQSARRANHQKFGSHLIFIRLQMTPCNKTLTLK